jgi:hypothetical protein
MGTRWRGMLAPLGTSTGDGRRFLASGVTHRELPLPLKWQRIDEAGHDTSVVVGSVDTIDVQDKAVWAEGTFFDDLDSRDYERLLSDVREAMLLTREKVIGPSVDAGAVEIVYARVGEDEPLSEDELEQMFWDEMETGEPAPIELLFTKYEISAATLVTTPAFAECGPFELLEPALTAAIRRDWGGYSFAPRDQAWDSAAAERRIATDAGMDGDSPDWARYAEAFLYQDDEADPETKGAYGFQILDAEDGTRLIVPRAVFAVAAVLQGSRGGTTIPDQDQQNMKEVVSGLYNRMADEFDDDTIVAPWDASISTSAALVDSLTAAAATRVYDLAAFAPPADPAKGLVNITVTEDGRVFGHIATHDVCHLGIPGVCMTAPVDLTEFDRFHRYTVMGSDGEQITVGRITFGGGRFVNDCECCHGNDDHACSALSMGGAIAHHDQMTTVALVRAWEDEENNAIWIAGVLAPDASAADIKALARGRVSGDWRSVGGDLRLVEILALSRERAGFPLPRGRMVSGQMMALTAAGTVSPRRTKRSPQLPVIDYEKLSTMIADRLAETGAFGPDRQGAKIDPSTDLTTTSDRDNDQTGVEGEATALTMELGLIFAGRDEAEARRLAGEVEKITHVLR